jgi:hypothetical protein
MERYSNNQPQHRRKSDDACRTEDVNQLSLDGNEAERPMIDPAMSS